MPDYIRDAFARMDLQQIRSFLLYGTEDFADRTRPYKETLKKESNAIYKRLESLYPDGDKLDKAVADLSQALNAYEHVYTELGSRGADGTPVTRN